MSKQATAYPLRLPDDLRAFFQRRARELDRSLHWVLIKTLDDAASQSITVKTGPEKEKAPNV